MNMDSIPDDCVFEIATRLANANDVVSFLNAIRSSSRDTNRLLARYISHKSRGIFYAISPGTELAFLSELIQFERKTPRLTAIYSLYTRMYRTLAAALYVHSYMCGYKRLAECLQRNYPVFVNAQLPSTGDIAIVEIRKCVTRMLGYCMNVGYNRVTHARLSRAQWKTLFPDFEDDEWRNPVTWVSRFKSYADYTSRYQT